MSSKIIDISITLDNYTPADPAIMRPQINYINHHQSVEKMCANFPGLTKEDLYDGEAGAVEKIKLGTHNGTHLDAPYHFHSTSQGKPAKTIDEIPLEWCFQNGIKLDFRHFADGYVVTAEDVKTELKRIQHSLKPLEIVLINTKAGARYGSDDYVDSGCGMGREATIYLLQQGVKITGTDAWSWDAPFSHTRKKFAETGNSKLIWEGHKVGKDMEYCHLEKLHNLEQLPAVGFQVCCFPVKIKKASAGWTRAVAIIDE
ncbi:MAG: cyclase family protein [Candidatus Marithrix sp.]